MKKALIFDWDGTIAHKELATIAAVKQMNMMGMDVTIEKMHEFQKTHSHYDDVFSTMRKLVGNYDDSVIIPLTTNLFQFFYLETANKNPSEIFYKDMFDVLNELKKDYKLLIASNLRQDILEPITEKYCPNLFDKVYANTPDLKYSKTDLVKKACDEYECISMIGDREDDINAGTRNDLETVIVSWGYRNGEKCNPTHRIESPLELLKIYKL
ncbi:hypothetical protein C0585_01585 [Candidatus Woesearchaeota archaeon]|nr:MAG: hypothetical protein C0585_01585 [Candidatus Woesearchaeota archaeon]